MTYKDCYIFGWVYGRVSVQLKRGFGDIAKDAEAFPLTSFAQILSDARRERALTPELDREIGAAVANVETTEPNTFPLPPVLQGGWQLGFFRGLSGQPLPDFDFNIAKARKAKGMTQQQLADEMGVAREVVSRWESGSNIPKEENLDKLKEILV